MAAPEHRGSDGPFETADTSWQGTSQFVQLAIERLGRERVHITATLDYGELTEADGILILHPTVELSFEEVSRFLRSGGRLALFDDFGRGDHLLERFGIRRTAAPHRPRHALRNNPGLAIATPTVEMVAGVERGRHPMVAEVEQVITNHPVGLLHPELTPVLEMEALDGASVSFAVTGIIANRGRMLAVGDPSIFINLMVRYPGNLAFAEGTIDYLVADDDWGPRGGRLFILANDFRQTGHFGDDHGFADTLAEHLRDLREDMTGWRESGLPDRLVWVLTWLGLALSGLWLFRYASRTYHPTVPRFVRPLPDVAQGGTFGRASVLAAETTNVALPLLELKVALQEALGRKISPGAPPPLERLPERCRRDGLLSPKDCDLLEKVAARLGLVEQSVVRGAPLRLQESELLQIHQDVLGLVRRARPREPIHLGGNAPFGPPQRDQEAKS